MFRFIWFVAFALALLATQSAAVACDGCNKGGGILSALRPGKLVAKQVVREERPSFRERRAARLAGVASASAGSQAISQSINLGGAAAAGSAGDASAQGRTLVREYYVAPVPSAGIQSQPAPARGGGAAAAASEGGASAAAH